MTAPHGARRHGSRRAPSVQRRVGLLVAAAVALSVAVISAVVFLVVRGQVQRSWEDELRTDSRTVAEDPGAWVATGPGADPQDPDHDGDHDIGPRVQILSPTGTVAGPGARLPVSTVDREVAAGRRAEALRTVRVGDDEYRMLTTPAEHGGAVQVATDTAAGNRMLGRVGLVLLVAGAAGIALATLLGRQVARAGLAPVHRLAAEADRIARTQDLAGQLEVTGHDEVARLGTAFNRMLAALASSRAAQRLLVEDAGHELRTPLTSLRTNIEVLARSDATGPTGTLDAADRADLLRDLTGQTAELSRLVTELVELAREDTVEAPEPVDLAALVRSAADALPGTPVERDLAPLRVTGRPDSLSRAVANLLDNAAKWGPPGAPVRLRLRRDGRHAELTVADSGPGFAGADLSRVFERFYRAPAARARPGSGLGLAIVAQAVALHDGTVTAGASDTGGALLTVRLPALPD